LKKWTVLGHCQAYDAMTPKDAVITECIEDYIFSLTDSCPPIAQVVDQYIYTVNRRYHWNGAIHIECNLKYGVMHGSYRSWYEDGKPICAMTYENGKEHGMQTIWTSDGHLHSRRMFEHGERHGTTFEWHNDRQLRSREEYVRGKRHGEYIEWHRNGVKRKERTYENGEIVGVSKEWNDQGTLIYEITHGEESTIWARAIDAEENLNHTLEEEETERRHRDKRCRFM
jgi:hypothetical protein